MYKYHDKYVAYNLFINIIMGNICCNPKKSACRSTNLEGNYTVPMNLPHIKLGVEQSYETIDKGTDAYSFKLSRQTKQEIEINGDIQTDA